MFNKIEESTKHFFGDILKLQLEKADQITGELYGASILLHGKEDGDYHFYVFVSKAIFEYFRSVFLKNYKFNEDDFCDLAKECANEIVGYAKTNLQEDGKEYKIGIPEYLGRIDFSAFELDESLTYKVNGHSFRIGYKKV